VRKRKPDRVCEKCHADWAISGERFCKPCRKIELDNMKNDGYLSTGPIRHAGASRTSESKEDVWSTKYGRDG
jgi:hypothetical protein